MPKPRVKPLKPRPGVTARSARRAAARYHKWSPRTGFDSRRPRRPPNRRPDTRGPSSVQRSPGRPFYLRSSTGTSRPCAPRLISLRHTPSNRARSPPRPARDTRAFPAVVQESEHSRPGRPRRRRPTRLPLHRRRSAGPAFLRRGAQSQRRLEKRRARLGAVVHKRRSARARPLYPFAIGAQYA